MSTRNQMAAKELLRCAKALLAECGEEEDVKVAAEDPRKEYEKDAKRIDSSIRDIVKNWKTVKSNYEEQLQNEPDSWRGIGRGSELPDLARSLEDISEMLISRMT